MDYNYIGSKNFLVNARLDDDRSLVIVEMPGINNSYISIEIFTYEKESDSVIIWYSKEEMIKEIGWQEWMIDGIIDDEFRKEVEEYLNSEETKTKLIGFTLHNSFPINEYRVGVSGILGCLILDIKTLDTNLSISLEEGGHLLLPISKINELRYVIDEK